MKAALVVLGVVVLGVLVVFGGLMSSRNSLVAEREAIKGSWAQVDAALQRRADLIPNLVETVKGAGAHEEKVIEEVTSARAAMMGAKSPQEKIEANENFLQLQDELSRTENRINVERRKYNESVQKYNTDIALFPNNIAAGMFNFQRNDAYFKTEASAKTPPKVTF